MNKCAALLSFWLLAVTTSPGATTIQFDPGPPGRLISRIIPEWTEAGLRFSTPNGLSHVNPTNPGGPNDGSAFLAFLRVPSQSPLSITNIAGGYFTVLSVDLAEYSTVFPFPKTVSFTGIRSDASTVSIAFTTDGAIDGRGGVADFQTFFFPPEFADLVSLRVDTDAYSMDNLVVVLDSDGDGVSDEQDQCAGTDAGSPVDEHGCSIDQLVPCVGPVTGGAWRNHGQYTRAVLEAADAFVAAGFITMEERNAFVRAAARSDCGKR